MYTVKEIFYTIQGEGYNAGRPAVFCRFTGCNLWSGNEDDRSTAICKFCDTDFLGYDGPDGGKFINAEDLANRVSDAWKGRSLVDRLVVFTGGEPLLQLNEALVDAMHDRGFKVAVETNGTKTPPPRIDWLCVSPKVGAPLQTTSGNELKVVYPQNGLDPAALLGLNFKHFFIQPMDGPQLKENTRNAIEYCLANPTWRLSSQMHKVIGVR